MPDRVLFLTRRYPPSIGGMQTLSVAIWDAVTSVCRRPQLIAHGSSNWQLPLWMAMAVLRTLYSTRRGGVDFVLVGDALTYAFCRPAIAQMGTRHAVVVHGLDITYPNAAYRWLVHRALRHAPAVVALSQATADAAIAAGVCKGHVRVMRPALTFPPAEAADRAIAAHELRRRLAIADDAIVLLTLGRLVRRKGVDWFTEEVLVKLDERIVFVIAGDGPLSGKLRRAITRLGLDERVRLMGRVSDEDRELLLRGADLFVQPNVRVPGDIEGFGLVLLEAAARGTPVLAAAVDGITDAVSDGETGYLLPAEDAVSWAARLREMTADPDLLPTLGVKFQREVRRRYDKRGMEDSLLGLLRGL